MYKVKNISNQTITLDFGGDKQKSLKKNSQFYCKKINEQIKKLATQTPSRGPVVLVEEVIK